MNGKYKHIFFDLDHTLWDFEKNTAEAIEEIYRMFEFWKWSFTLQDLMEYFREVNIYLWDKFNRGLIDRDELRNTRFDIILRKLGVPQSEIPKSIGEKYLEIAPVKPHVIPHTHDILGYLKQKYHLHIISNGFDDVQHIKLRSSNIHHYFEKIITSDSSGHRKPQKEIFEFAMNEAGATPNDTLMIGDNFETDIIGAQNAGIDYIYFNHDNIPHDPEITPEINSLSELRNIL